MTEFRKIELYKERDFSHKMNATIEFIRQNFKNLAKNIIYIAGPFILIIAILNVYLQVILVSDNLTETNLVPFGLSSLLLMFITFVAVIMVITVVNSYIKIYHQRGNNDIEVSEVWKHTRKYFFSNLLAYVISVLVSVIGFVFFIIPGIYLMVAFSLIFIIIVQEDVGAFDALSRCFTLISGKWWSTFGLLLVTAIIVGLISSVFAIPIYVLQFLVGISAFGEPGFQTGDNAIYEAALMVFTVLQSVASYMLYTIVYVALAFQYGNLVERKEAVGLMDKIDNLGKKPDDEEISI